MKELDVLGVRVELPTSQPILVLRDRDSGRHLPVWVGAPEATAIAYAQQGVEPPRPLTHDLIVALLGELGHELREVRLTSMTDGVYYACLVVDDEETLIDCRPSDAIAVALRAGCPVRATDDLVETVGIVVAGEDEDEVEQFKEFLDQVSPEDFEDFDDPGSTGGAGGSGGSSPST